MTSEFNAWWNVDSRKPLTKLDRFIYPIFYKTWIWWHISMRNYKPFMNKDRTFYCRNRPWWHMCCNGDNGGWRTAFCRYLEDNWRAIETKFDHTNGTYDGKDSKCGYVGCSFCDPIEEN